MGGGSDAETLRSHRPPPPCASSHPLGSEWGWGRSDRCPPQPGGRPQSSRIVPALSPQPQSAPPGTPHPRWSRAPGTAMGGRDGGGLGEVVGQQVRPYLIPGRGGGGAQEGEQSAQPHPAASRPRVAAAAPPPRPPRPRSSSGAAAVRGQQPGKERRAAPPPPRRGPRRLEVGGLRPRPVPHSPAFCSLCPGVGGTPGPGLLRRDHRSPMERFSTAPSPKARGDGGSSHPPPLRDPQQRQRTPPVSHAPLSPPAAPPANGVCPPLSAKESCEGTPGPLGCREGTVSPPRWDGADPAGISAPGAAPSAPIRPPHEQNCGRGC